MLLKGLASSRIMTMVRKELSRRFPSVGRIRGDSVRSTVPNFLLSRGLARSPIGRCVVAYHRSRSVWDDGARGCGGGEGGSGNSAGGLWSGMERTCWDGGRGFVCFELHPRSPDTSRRIAAPCKTPWPHVGTIGSGLT
eukprot:364300-Chlamydomonas_euryale.AAC.4